MTKILVLGGTTEARALCGLMAAHGIPGLVSLAGRVPSAKPYAIDQVTGGFGGACGLVNYLRDQAIDVLIDATHPFASVMPFHASKAASEAGIAFAMLKRPEWISQAGDNWQHVPDLNAAAEALPTGARAFLATGAGSIKAFCDRKDCTLVLRQMTAPENTPDHIVVIQAMPEDVIGEAAVLQGLRATHLVAKNSGGPTRAKLDAARHLALPVILVDRPPCPDGLCFETPTEALNWAMGIA